MYFVVGLLIGICIGFAIGVFTEDDERCSCCECFDLYDLEVDD